MWYYKREFCAGEKREKRVMRDRRVEMLKSVAMQCWPLPPVGQRWIAALDSCPCFTWVALSLIPTEEFLCEQAARAST